MPVSQVAERVKGRRLPVEDWPKLAQTETELATCWEQLDPQHTIIVVVEEGGDIVAACAIYSLIHVDGLWVRPDHRSQTTTNRQLLSTLMATLSEQGLTQVIAQPLTDADQTRVERLGGQRLPGYAYVLPVREI